MSALDDIFLGFDEVFEACQEQTILRARAELAQLRAERDILSDRAKSLEEEALIVMAHKDKIIANLQTKIAEQARQLAEAREIIGVAKNDYQSDVQDGVDSYDKCQRCIDWLAANPAPQEPQP